METAMNSESRTPSSAVNTSRRKLWLPLALLTIAVGCLLAVLLAPIGRKRTATTAVEQPEIRFVLPAFSLTDRSGKTIANDDLKGKVWIASFVFTRCTGPCPSVSATVAKLQTELDLANRDDLRFVTFTVDPDRDGLKELAKYADNFRAHPDRWLFLTGGEREVHALMTNGFKLGITRSTTPSTVEGQEFDHSTMIAVVDQQGVARGYFDGYRGPNDTNGEKYDEAYAKLKALVERLSRE